MCVFRHHRNNHLLSLYFPLLCFLWVHNIIQERFFYLPSQFLCICVYTDAPQTVILHVPCQFPLCISHIMNLFKQKSFSAGTFLFHLFPPPPPMLLILISKQHCNSIYCLLLSCFSSASPVTFRVGEVVVRKYTVLGSIYSQEGLSYSKGI